MPIVIEETPAKRRKTNLDDRRGSYDSIVSSTDYQNGFSTEKSRQSSNMSPASPKSPTVTTSQADSVIQIEASSPAQPVESTPLPKSSLSTSLAPLGTSFRAPISAPSRPGATVVVSSGDEDDSNTIAQNGSSGDEAHKLKANIRSFTFQPQGPTYDATNRLNAWHREQGNKQLAHAVMKGQSFVSDDIADYQLRSKVKRMHTILPQHSVRECYEVLLLKRANYADAMDYLAAQEKPDATINLVSDDDKKRSPAKPLLLQPPKPSAKQHIRAPVQKIYDKYTANRQVKEEKRDDVVVISDTNAQKPKKKLVRGGKHVLASNSKTNRPITPDRTSEDSTSELDISKEQMATGSGLLNFLNTCSLANLIDISSVPSDIATTFLNQRPFKSLGQARSISYQAKQEQRPKIVGEKIIEKCIAMWDGYEAVDQLVAQCERLAAPVRAKMKDWTPCYQRRDRDASEIRNGRTSPIPENSTVLPSSVHFKQPPNMKEGVVLKDYQIFGVKWLTLLFEHKLSAILADDMGLGKTCQVIAFLAHLLHNGIKGPHVVILPGSTLENWMREFANFCPDLVVAPYYADLKDRPTLQEDILDNPDINVVVTTYTIAKKKDDNRFLRKLKPVCCVFDEGHALKNSKSAGYQAYMRIPAKFRLLLTGTPLQNNLQELASLLGFILPSIFDDHREALEAIFSHKAKTTDENGSRAALLSDERTNRAKSMMAPFVLRRKKAQVLQHLPAKICRVEYCDLTASQRSIYEQEQNLARNLLDNGSRTNKTSKQGVNVLMALRKAAIHPLLFRRQYNDAILTKMSKSCLGEEQFADSDQGLVFEDMSVMDDIELHLFCQSYPRTMSPYSLQEQMWMDSGKVGKLKELLVDYKQHGHRALIFSQFVMVMNILELVLESLGIRFFRLDGTTPMEERQTMIDEFYEDEKITVFMLSTKAGGAGINLACANKVLIFDSSFNPQDDIQAENRAHRVGQKREVEVIRFISRDTIEEQIHALGETKLALDARVAGDAEGSESTALEKRGEKIVEDMLRSTLVKDTKPP